jgi:hypothetical protein
VYSVLCGKPLALSRLFARTSDGISSHRHRIFIPYVDFLEGDNLCAVDKPGDSSPVASWVIVPIFFGALSDSRFNSQGKFPCASLRTQLRFFVLEWRE